MRIYFATNRNPNNDANPTNFGKTFSKNGLTDLRFGWADVDDDDLESYTLYVAKEHIDIGIESAIRNDFSAQILGSQEVFKQVQDDMKTLNQDCIIYIHGFDYTFKEAITRAAELKRFYQDRPSVFFLFTWPSNGKRLPFVSYASDRDDARASGTAMGRGMQKLAHFLRNSSVECMCERKLHIMAHSMGNYTMRWALQGIRSNSGANLRRLFDQIIMFAADEDADAFELSHKLSDLPKLTKQITLYHNPEDKALIISDLTKGNPDRLGAGGPQNSHAIPDKVNTVNCEYVIDHKDDKTGHQYYYNNKLVRKDVMAVLDGQKPDEIDGRTYIPQRRAYQL